MKNQLSLLCILLLGLGWGRALACHNSDLSLTSCTYDQMNSEWVVDVKMNVGCGRTGPTTGGDQATKNIYFTFYSVCSSLALNSFSPATITGTYTNCSMIGSLGTTPTLLGSNFWLRYYQGTAPCSAASPFACITNTTICGPARSEPYNFTFRLNSLPDSIRLRGVEANGSVAAGCSNEPDMLIDFRQITCPTTQQLAVGGSCTGTLPDYTSLIDTLAPCSVGLPTIMQSPMPGTVLSALGLSSVMMYAIYAPGDTATCAFQVSLEDTTLPTISCPASFTFTPTGLDCNPIVTWTAATATDNCGVTDTCTPASGSALAVGPTVVTYVATDASGNTSTCDFTVTVAAPAITGTTTASDPNPCNGDTVTLSNATVATSFLWSTGDTTAAIQVTASGLYWVEATGAIGCTARDTIVVNFATDCVWPGDANHDGIADNQDLLAVGLGFGYSGLTRPGASGSWYGQPAPDWATSLPSLVNHKHTDCNGDGTIDYADTTLIIANYGFTHLKGTGLTAGIPLYIVPELDSFPAGDTVFFKVYWGDANNPVTSGHGLAFSYHIDAVQITPSTFYMRHLNSFLGNGTADLLTLTYPETAGSNWHIGLSRHDGVGHSGSGAITRVGFLPSQVYPLTQTLGYIPVHLFNAMAIDQNFNPLLVSAMDDSIFVYSTVIAQGPPQPLQGWNIYPNPTAASAVLDLQLGAAAQVEATLIDLQGRPLRTILTPSQVNAGRSQTIIETTGLSEGMYFIRLNVDGRVMSRKFVIQH